MYSIANLEAINAACTAASFGKLTAEALYVHAAYVSELPTLLHVYEGAARRLTGDVDDATIIKLNRLKPQVSFLVYPGFETDPHPAIEASVVAKLGDIRVKYRYFGNSGIQRSFIARNCSCPCGIRLAQSSRASAGRNERVGLLDRPDIGTDWAWRNYLATAGLELRGHRLVKTSGVPAGG